MRPHVTALGLFCLLACQSQSRSYLPLTPGMVLQYQGTFHDSTMRISMSNLAARELAGKQVTPQKYESGDATASSFQFLATDSTGTYMVATQDPADPEPKLLTRPKYLIKEPIQVGASWTGLEGKTSSTVAIKSLDEVVTVPAGTFEHCMLTESRTDLIRLTWYAPGVGVIKQITSKQAGESLMTLQLVQQSTVNVQ